MQWTVKDGKSTHRKKSTMQDTRRHSTYTLGGIHGHSNSTAQKVWKKIFSTASAGDIKFVEAVKVPQDMIDQSYEYLVEDNPDANKTDLKTQAYHDARNKWLAANAVDFWKEVSMLYGFVEEAHIKMCEVEPSSAKEAPGFPPGMQYQIREAKGNKVVTGDDYCNLALVWCEDTIHNKEVFPEDEGVEFPDDFDEYIRNIFKRLVRIFVIIITRLMDDIEEADSTDHLKSSFKHFYFFIKSHEMVQNRELDVLKNAKDMKNRLGYNVQTLKEEYDEAVKKMKVKK